MLFVCFPSIYHISAALFLAQFEVSLEAYIFKRKCCLKLKLKHFLQLNQFRVDSQTWKHIRVCFGTGPELTSLRLRLLVWSTPECGYCSHLLKRTTPRKGNESRFD